MRHPSSLPPAHGQLLDKIVDCLSQDQRIIGLGISGSYTTNSMDKYSDLDLVVAVEPSAIEAVMVQRIEIVNQIGGLLAAFTGEHVGEPRLIIALFEPDTIHVDFKFVSLPDAATRVDDTKVLWEHDGLLSAVLDSADFQYPQPDAQWIEDRFWVWSHYGATKIARGEYFEALEFMSFLRATVLSPLALRQNNMTPSGVRKIEARLPTFSNQLKERLRRQNTLR